MFKHFLTNYNSLILESFKDAQTVFSRDNDPELVQQILKKYRDLNQKGKFQGNEKDITYWMKKPFHSLQQAVSGAEQIKSKNDKKSKSIKLAQNGDWVAIAPLSQEASCYYGAGTKWCTAATNSHNHFNPYFHRNKVDLIYFINKKTGEKLAAASNPKVDEYECFNAEDQKIQPEEIEQKTGMKLSHVFSDAEDHEAPVASRREYSKEQRKPLEAFLAKAKTEYSLDKLRNMPKEERINLDEEVERFRTIRDFVLTNEDKDQLGLISGNLRQVSYAVKYFKDWLLDKKSLENYVSMKNELNPAQLKALEHIAYNVGDAWENLQTERIFNFLSDEARTYLNNREEAEKTRQLLAQADQLTNQQ